ncbi:MAG: hypothetical protein SWY16_16290 [Cyanobacteriota bacterium]|nr:hypothetical protein [Cyanobacteriota bacterium]
MMSVLNVNLPTIDRAFESRDRDFIKPLEMGDRARDFEDIIHLDVRDRPRREFPTGQRWETDKPD